FGTPTAAVMSEATPLSVRGVWAPAHLRHRQKRVRRGNNQDPQENARTLINTHTHSHTHTHTHTPLFDIAHVTMTIRCIRLTHSPFLHPTFVACVVVCVV